jgi:type I restriction enzyme, S subunit
MSAREVRPGFKQTEVGVIPEDWNVEPLSKFASVQTGPFGTLLKASEYSESGGVPLISVGEIRQGFLRVTEHTPRVSQATTRRLPQYVLKTGDIVFGRKGGVERSALIREDQKGWFLGSDGINVRPFSDHDNAYIAFQFQTLRVQRWLLQNALGTTMPSLNQDVLKRVSVVFPRKKKEQEAIAEALGDADALIDALEPLLAKKRNLKQGAMQELLTGKRRLSGFDHIWKVERLGSKLKFQVGFPFRSAYFNEDGTGVRLVKNRDLKSDDQMIYYSGPFDASFEVTNGDLLVGMDGDFLPCIWNKGAALLNQRIGRIVPSARIDRTFAFYFLIEPLQEIQASTSATTVKHLSHKDVESIEKPLPTIEEQTAIASILSDMDAEIATLERKLQKARAVKQGMMQELLTGRTRLK